MFARQVACGSEHRVTAVRQRTLGQILARVLARPLLDVAAWTKWCRCDPRASFVPTAVLAGDAVRLPDVRKVRLCKAGRTSIIKKSKAVKEQTGCFSIGPSVFGVTGASRFHN